MLNLLYTTYETSIGFNSTDVKTNTYFLVNLLKNLGFTEEKQGIIEQKIFIEDNFFIIKDGISMGLL